MGQFFMPSDADTILKRFCLVEQCGSIFDAKVIICGDTVDCVNSILQGRSGVVNNEYGYILPTESRNVFVVKELDIQYCCGVPVVIVLKEN